MTAIRQLALPFDHTAHYDAAEFLPDASNAEARAWLSAPWPDRRLALWGGEGFGKTHLLHVWAEHTGAALFPGPAVRSLLHRPLTSGLAVDDADVAPEEPLLHLLNRAAEAGVPVLLAARDAPGRWPTRLPDLASRLRATVAVGLHPPEDAMLRVLLARLLADRQLLVAAPVQEWLLLRLPRHPGALREAAARLDRAALAQGRSVTRALAADVLAAYGEGLDAADEQPGDTTCSQAGLV